MVATTEDKKKYKLTHKQVDETVDSPYIQVCTYDEEEEFCIGCYRSLFLMGYLKLSLNNFSTGNTSCNSADDFCIFLRLRFSIGNFIIFIIR